jgi:hypothetical protein
VIKGINNHENLCLNGNAGIHRTLTYLVPLLDYIEKNQSEDIKAYLLENNLSTLFEFQTLSESQVHGAVILVPHNLMIYRLYSLIRHLSPNLNVIRTNNISGIVGFSRYESQSDLKHMRNKYIEKFKIKSIYWKYIDIVVTTPAFLPSLFTIYPSTLVLDSIEQ